MGDDIRFNVTFNWPENIISIFDELASKHRTSKAVLSEAMVMAFRDLSRTQIQTYLKERNDLRVVRKEDE